MAFIKPKRRKDGTEVWEVRWYPHPGSNQKSKSFYDPDDAEEFVRELRRAQSRGEPAPEPHRRRRAVTLGDWYLEHRERAGWERNTQKNYRSVFRAHVADSSYGIADEPLPTLSDERIARFRDDMDGAGVPANAQSKTLTLVSSLLSAAAERRSYTGVRQNPMLRGGVKKPRAKRVRPVLVFAPVAFEAVRFELLHAPGRSERERARDALWQSCTSLAGLRPEEAWALQPDFFRERTIAVLQAVAHGEVKRTKEDEWHYPPLHPLLREELDAYLERWPVEFGQLVFDDPARPGKPIADHNWRNWRKRVWRGARDRALAHVPARERAKLTAARPYDLGRHSYASLRLRAGMSNNLAGLVAELGHTTISQLSATYAHEIAEYRGTEPVDWVAEVRSARAKLARRTPGSDA